MKHYTLPFARAIEHVPSNPERTAYRSSGFDITFKEFSNRPAMLKCIDMQQTRAPHHLDWKDWTNSRFNKTKKVEA